jgi:predicted DNA-binding ArsR family transcriptional regulator
MTRITALPPANFHSSEGWVQINIEQSFQNLEKMIDQKSAIKFL